MIKFFTSRALSQRLEINLAKWKRWSREFLPPDPLGGMQSGYARQYHPDQAFTVYLGGLLVSDLKFTIPEAKQILQDLQGWLTEKGFYFNGSGKIIPVTGEDEIVKKYILLIEGGTRKDDRFDFIYTVRGIISNESVDYKGIEIMTERYTQIPIDFRPETPPTKGMNIVKMLKLTDILDKFANLMDLNPINYPAISLRTSL
jgi:hypothetical protein